MNEYEKLRMRQNPMLQQRAQVGGRSMPAWFASSLVNQSRIGAPSPPPPPLPAEPPPVESDYEEIDHLPKNQMKKNSSRRSCSLCGNPNPAVSCEMCNDQIFCGSCNDMYHRHPKRQHHSRKILEPIVDNRPPLPPKTPVPPEMALPPLPPSHPPGQYPTSGAGSVPTPQPPPRRKGRFGMRSAAGSPTTGIKSFFDPVGTLKKFMGGMAHRPLPPPPKPAPPLPPKPAELGRSMTPTFRGPMLGDRRLNSPQPGAFPQDERRAGMPMSAMDMQNSRMHSMSVANLSGHMGSRDSGYPDWEEDDEADFFSRNRAQSVSGGVLGRFPSTSQDASHFATLHRPGRNQRQQLPQSTTSLSSPQSPTSRDNPPERPPPPLPPRQFPSQTQLSFQSSQSAFDLDRMAAVAQQQNAAAFGMPPWNYPMPMQGYPYDFQQAMMMGFPGSGTMHRTPSTQSMGPSMNPASGPPNQQQPFFGWGPMGFGPPMSQMEMEMMTRRGSEQFMNLLPPQQSQRGVPLSNPVTPQGSFRKKTGRHMSVEPEFTRRLDNRSGLDFSQNRRSGTPSSFVRVQPSSSSVASSPAPSIPSAFASTKPIKPPAKPPSNSDQSPDDSYFSAEKQQLTESSESTPELTENPEGPWECEHCTFINPKSTKVCTICCKTPSAGFKPMKGKKNAVGAKGRWGKKAASVDPVPSPTKSASSSSRSRRDSSKESASSATTGTDEVVPVLKSKLSISRDQKQQQTKIDLVSKVEKERVKKSAMKAGSSGTLKAGMVPPEVKAAIFKASAPKKKSTKSKVVAPVVQVETDEDDEEELIAEPEADEKEEEGVDYDQGSSEKEEDDEEEEDEDEEEDDDDDGREQKSDDENADDEENGVVNVKITAASSKMGGRAGQISRGKVAAAVAPSKKAVTSTNAAVKTKTVRARSSTSQTRRLVDSNEDVYGSVPIQALAISPKIDIKRPSKSKVSTSVGTSPPNSNEITPKGTKKSSKIISSPPPSSEHNEETQKDDNVDVKIDEKIPESEENKAVEVENNCRNSPEMSTITVSVTPSSTKAKKTKKVRKMSVSTGTQAESEKKEESPSKKESSSSSPFQAGKDVEEKKAAVTDETEKPESEAVKAKVDLDTATSHSSGKDKSSVGVGTSPPPQSISTQTYEDAPTESSVTVGSESTLAVSSGMGTTKSSSKTSLKSDNEYYDAPRHIEMSEKAMRYARKAKNREQHYQKLKRSLSTQLTYPGEPWMDSAEGRNLYRSSSRQSLMSDTRSLPMSGPPSRDSSPPPMGRYSGMESRGGTGSRGGWYEDFRRYPPSAWDSRYGMPPDSFFASIDDIMSRRRKESMRSQEFELTRMLKDAEEYNFSPEDVQVGIRMCGDKNPIKWLQENWLSMIETVQTLATKYGYEKGIENNDVGTISIEEAKESIRSNRGNVWAAVTECVDQRRRKFHELESRGTFLREDILTALTANNGNLEAAYVELSKAQLKPFLMRIWGQPGTTDTDDTESVAPASSSDETSKSKKATVAVVKEPQSSSKSVNEQPPTERSSSLPGPPETKAKKTRKTSLATGKLTKTSSATTQQGAKEEQKPKLEDLVFSAEKVTQEIEKAIQELKRKGSVAAESENHEIEADEHVTKVEEPEELTEANVQEDESRDPVQTDGLRLKSESESEHSSVAAQHLKSDDGEDESFADAVSGSVSIANSPPPIPASPQNEVNDDENEINELLLTEINNNTINITLNDNNEEILDEEEEEFEDDVLEIEIDDTEANVSEFIQNYETLPAEQAVTPLSGEEQEVEDDDHHSEEDEREIEDNEAERTEGDENDGASASENDKAVTKVEIEKLMTALTSTFSEMEQFAYKMKENIATEIQQQLAAATGKSNKGSSHDHSEDGSYEPIALPPGIEENVNKKVAKYQKLAAKKKQKVGRHKSPETRAFQLGDIGEKEPSVSPLPSTSEEKLRKKKRVNQKDDEKASGDSTTEQQEVEDEEGIEKETTAQSRLSDYEEVEIGQEDEEKFEVVVQENDAPHDEGEFNVEAEDVNESSVVEESEEEIVIEAGEGEQEEEEEDEEEVEDNDGNAEGDIYANVEISGGMSITPSDTDKIIVAGGNMAAAAKTIRNNANAAGNKENEEDAVVIVAEDLNQKEEAEKTEVEAEVVVGQVEIEETPAQRLIKEGKADTVDQAELALQLVDMNFSEDDALSAAKECSSLCAALSWLQQECDLCTGKFSAREMVSMIHCTHLCCRNCAREYFTVQVRDKTIVDATCPFCAEPSVLTDDSELATDYFNHLDILLKNLLDSKHHEMFQRKLRDWTLAKTPNFKWCSKCSSGFITEPMQTRLVCPDCKAVTCAVCMETWDKVNHNHRDDSASSSMKLCDTTPKSIIEYLNANHIECPRCHFRFSLARGGCMHLTCTQCHHEFCSGCAAPFRMGDKCEAKYPICDKLGLHAHHPRNCLFYLRDKEPDVLAKLLEENAIPYFKENSGEEKTVTVTSEVEAPTTETAEGNETTEISNDTNEKANTKTVTQRVCQVPIQKETSDGYIDDICGKEAPEGYATVCKTHYIEYLGLLIWQNHLDPITILTNDDLEVIVRRAFKKHPGRPNWLSDELFRKRLLKVINDEIPL